MDKKPATELSDKQRGEKPNALKLKYGVLPSLDKKASRTRLGRREHEQQAADGEESVATSQTSMQVTHKVPLTTTVRGGVFGRGVSNPRLPNKSLPRLAAGRKPDRPAKNRDQDSTEEPSLRDPPEADADKPSILLSSSSKTMAGFSEGKTKTNQDSMFSCTALKGSSNSSLFAVFDGHGTLGHKVSGYLKLHIGDAVELRFDPQKSYEDQDYASILESACLEVNSKLVNNALFVSGEEFLQKIAEVCADGYAKLERTIGVPADCRAPLARPLPSDPAPFEHPTKIAVLRLRKK